MGKVQNNQDISQFDHFTKKDWTKFLKSGAYRGSKINKLATRLNANPLHELIKDQTEIKLTYRAKNVTIKLTKLIKKHDDWTLSRLSHNFKMIFSSKYAKAFNKRIDQLADELSKINQRSGFPDLLSNFVDDQVINTHTSDDIEAFFYNNQKLIDGSTGDQVIQDNLYKLSGLTREKFNDGNLAHLIGSKATAVMPPPVDMSLSMLPDEVQALIFSNLPSFSTLNQLLVSKQTSKIVSRVKNTFINEYDICVGDLNCKTAEEAVKYIIAHQLTAANLSDFSDFNDEDLDNLSKCTYLKKLSLNSKNFSGDKLVHTLKNFDQLEDINLSHCSKVSANQLLEILQDHNNLQGLSLMGMEIDDEIAKAIVNLSHLQRLSLIGSSNLPEDQLVELLEKNSNIQNLNLNNLDTSSRIVNAICNLKELKDIALAGLTEDEIAEILEKQKSIKYLFLPDINDRIFNAVMNLTNLDHLNLYQKIPTDQITDILKKHIHLRSLHVDPDQKISDETIEAVNDLKMLQNLKMPARTVLKMKVNHNIKSIDLSYSEAAIDEYYEAIDKFPNLRHLYIFDCTVVEQNGNLHTSFSPKEVNQIITKYPYLKIQ